MQWFFHPLDGLKLAQAIVQHGDFEAAAKEENGGSGITVRWPDPLPEQPIITSGVDQKFRYVGYFW